MLMHMMVVGFVGFVGSDFLRSRERGLPCPKGVPKYHIDRSLSHVKVNFVARRDKFTQNS